MGLFRGIKTLSIKAVTAMKPTPKPHNLEEATLWYWRLSRMFRKRDVSNMTVSQGNDHIRGIKMHIGLQRGATLIRVASNLGEDIIFNNAEK